jgi:hypothetical protein
MSLVTEKSKKSVSKTSRPSTSWVLRFIIAVAGGVASFWLASRQNVHNLPPLPTLKERFWLVAPTLFEGAAGIFFVIWILLLIREYKNRSAQKWAANSHQDVDATHRKREIVKWTFLAVYIVVASLHFSADTIRYLWPSCPHWIEQSSRGSFDLLTLAGVFFEVIFGKQKKSAPKPEAGNTATEESWISGRQIKLIVFLLAGIAFLVYVDKQAAMRWPLHVHSILGVSAVLFTGALLMFAQMSRDSDDRTPSINSMARDPRVDNESDRGRKLRRNAAIWIYGTIFALVMVSPLRPEIKRYIFYGQFLALIVVGALVLRVKHWVYQLGHGGEFDRALRIDRRLSVLPFYGSPLAGSILFNAGRYSEALVYLKPLAFDGYGQPRLTSTALYTYALALVNSEHEAEAQELLEVAVRVRENPETMKVALATCLLTQNKEPERACSLLEQAFATSGMVSRADRARRTGRYAYALAACARRKDAEARIQEAFSQAVGLKPSDQAGVHYFVGEAWRSLGETNKARAEFDQAVALAPDGVAALSAKKALAKMWAQTKA